MTKILTLTLLFFLFLSINANSQCNASFTTSVNIAVVTAQPVANGPQLKHYWHMGDGNVIQMPSVQYGYAQPGTYNIKHIVWDTVSGCRDSVINQVSLNFTPSCGANILYSVDTSAYSHTKGYFFYCQTLNLPGNSYTWAVDGVVNQSSALSIVAGLDPGVHTVCLKVTTQNCSDSACVTITVPPPVACGLQPSFSYMAPGPNGAEVHFSATPVPAGYYYFWKFGDGNTGSGRNPVHVYNSGGPKSVWLYVFNPLSNCVDSVMETTFVQQPLCNAGYSTTMSGSTINFQAVLNAPGVSHLWQFGDGSSATGPVVSHTYSQAGVFPVKHFVVNTQSGCSDSTTVMTTVAAPPCEAHLTITPAPSGVFNNFVFKSESSTSQGTITSYQWKIDGQVVSSAPLFTQWLPSGAHSICLTVTSSAGCTSTVCAQIFAAFPPSCSPGSAFTHSISNSNPYLVSFTGFPGGTAYQQFWLFGDGTSSNSINPQHLYPVSPNNLPVTYQVRLVTRDTVFGCSDTVYHPVVIQPNSCSAAFTYTLTGTSPMVGSFTAASNQSIATQAWTFYKMFSTGGITTSQVTNPTHSFSDTGFYLICLNLTTVTGCSASYCDTVKILPAGGRPSTDLIAFPNPASSKVDFRVDLPTAGIIGIAVYNASGIPVYQSTRAGVAGNQTISIPTANLGTGQFFIHLQHDSGTRKGVFQKL